jgi:hypothetical protein
MSRGGYWPDKAPRPTAHGASSGPVTPDRMKACLDVSSVDRVTLSDRGMSVGLPATLISPTGIAQKNSQVNWTTTMSSRGWQALHGLAEQPAALSTGIPHGPAVRARGNSGSRRGGHAGQQADRLLAIGLLPFCSPGGPFRCYSPTGRNPQHRAELRELPCRKPAPRGVYLPALQEVRGHFHRSKYAVDLQKRGGLRE